MNLIPVKEYAEYKGISMVTLYKYIKQGKLTKQVKDNSSFIVLDEEELAAYEANKKFVSPNNKIISDNKEEISANKSLINELRTHIEELKQKIVLLEDKNDTLTQQLINTEREQRQELILLQKAKDEQLREIVKMLQSGITYKPQEPQFQQPPQQQNQPDHTEAEIIEDSNLDSELHKQLEFLKEELQAVDIKMKKADRAGKKEKFKKFKKERKKILNSIDAVESQI
jgi:predicted DNA-binding transcriptional regulator AlpA